MQSSTDVEGKCVLTVKTVQNLSFFTHRVLHVPANPIRLVENPIKLTVLQRKYALNKQLLTIATLLNL